MAELYPVRPHPHVAIWRVVGASYMALGLLLLMAAADVVTPRWSLVGPIVLLLGGAVLVVNGLRARRGG